jgi:hypothetical protein
LFSQGISALVLPKGDRVSHDWLVKTNNPYLEEIKYFSERINLSGIFALNVCFEWGCTSSVYAKEEGPTVTRVLDWVFPTLGEHVIVAHQQGKAGEFYNVTWPALSGVFSGMAPQRFSAALNQAPMQRHRLTYIGDWVVNHQKVFRSGNIAPAHLLRQVFEESSGYEEAKERLAKTPLALPAIYTLAGTRQGEGCVIERTETDYAIRVIENDRVCAANQFETRLNAAGHDWRSRPIDSAGRLSQALSMPLGMIDDQFSWFQPPIANSHTRLAIKACAASGTMSVIGTEGEKRVTENFVLSQQKN